MQMQLPIFPASTKLVNSNVGIFEKDDFIYYLHNGSPIFCHDENDLNSYKIIKMKKIVKVTDILGVVAVAALPS
jgi:hypothetical protein